MYVTYITLYIIIVSVKVYSPPENCQGLKYSKINQSILKAPRVQKDFILAGVVSQISASAAGWKAGIHWIPYTPVSDWVEMIDLIKPCLFILTCGTRAALILSDRLTTKQASIHSIPGQKDSKNRLWIVF